jgi:hypothetical protein
MRLVRVAAPTTPAAFTTREFSDIDSDTFDKFEG